MKFAVPLLSAIILICSCHHNDKKAATEEKFDKAKWAIKNEKTYPYRDKMLKDLIADRRLTGIKRDSILRMLGEPARTDSSYLFYTVAQEFLGKIPVPLHTKSLVIKFAGDSTVQWVKIHE
jgi:hypothetical protein